MEATKFTKGQKTVLIMFALLALLDVFCLIHSIADHDTWQIVSNSLLTVNTLAVCCAYCGYIQAVRQRDEAKDYKDIFFKYYDFQYDINNTRGCYGIHRYSDRYLVYKKCDYICVFIVKVFPYDPADETAKATAKSKAEELLNLITENGTMWQ